MLYPLGRSGPRQWLGLLRPLAPFVLLIATLSVFGVGLARAQDVEDEGEEEVWVQSCDEVSGVCVHAGERRRLRSVDRPDRTRRSPTAVCVWYPYGKQPGGWGDPDGAVPVPYLSVGGLYVIDCHRVDDGSRLSGYPRISYHTGRAEIPGDAVSGWEVAKYASNRLGLDAPVPAVSPAGRSIVGTETWFAVTSRLRGYPQRSAQAGSTWATVRAYFSEATWDLGRYGELRCTADAGRAWNPALPGDRQSSDCTRIFERASGEGGLAATITVRWRIYWSSSEHSGWRYHSDVRLAATVRLDVVELQAVIR